MRTEKSKSMKIVFFGTPHLAACILEKLLSSRHEIVGVVTQPDRASGRGKNISFSPVKEVAMAADIRILQPEKVSDSAALDEIESLGADLHVVAAYAQKLPNRLLEMAPYGCINVHPSLLPKYRGAAPLMAAILNGDEKSGVTIMRMAEKMDTGDILLQEEMPLSPDETNVTIEAKAIELGGRLLIETIGMIEAGTAVGVPQDDEKSSYVKQIGKQDGLIDFGEEAAVIERKIRAFDPWPGTYTYLDGKTFKICSARVVPFENDGTFHKTGEAVSSGKNSFMIAAKDAYLEPLTVQLEGKKKMTVEEFLRGRKIEQGTILG